MFLTCFQYNLYKKMCGRSVIMPCYSTIAYQTVKDLKHLITNRFVVGRTQSTPEVCVV